LSNLDRIPGLDWIDAIDLRFDERQRFQVVDPQPDGEMMFFRKLAGESPANADVSKIVDDVAKDVPALHGALVSMSITMAERNSS
jgi:hypothetical protein